MLDLNTRFELFGVTLYRDRDQKDVIFYVPPAPTIPEDENGPMFDLFAYEKGGEQDDIEAGGFLTLAISTDLGDLERPILRKLQDEFGDDVRLTSIPFTEGSVRLAGLDTGAASINEDGTGGPPADPGPGGVRLVEKVFGAATPSLDNDNRAVFSLTLSEEGVAFFLDILEQGAGARPLIAIYDLKYTGLMEVEDLKIEIDFEQVYDFLRTKIGFNAVVVAGEIDNIVEDLKTSQAIKIDDTVRTLELSTPEAMAARQARIDALVKELATGAFFAPSLTVGDPAVDEDDVFGRQPDASMGMFASGVPSAVGQAIARTTRRAQATDADVNTPEPLEEDLPQDRAASNAGVNAANDAAGRPRATFTMRRLQQRERRRVTYDLSRTTALERSAGPQNLIAMMASPQELQRRIHKINLNHPMFARLRIDVEAGGVDFAAEGIREMTVNLRYGRRPDGQPKETADVVLRNAEDRASFVFARAEDGEGADGTYEYRVNVLYQTGFGLGDERTLIEGDWVRSEARTLPITPAMVAPVQPLNVLLPSVLPPDLTEVRTSVAYRDKSGVVEDSERFVLNATSNSALTHVRFSDPQDSVRITGEAIFADGTAQTLPEIIRPDPDGSDPIDVAVLPLPKRPILTFDVMMSDPMEEMRSVILEYEVTQDGAAIDQGAVELTEPLSRQSVSVVLNDFEPAPRVRIRERRVFRSGGIETTEFEDMVDRFVIAGIPAEDVITLPVRYLGPPLDTMSAMGVLLELSYDAPDNDPEFAQSHTFFIENREPLEWRVRVKDRDHWSFTHSATILFNDGSERRGEPVISDSDKLFLRSIG